MTNKKNYSRYFIILQEEEKGYSLASDKLPSGYAKIETKNDKCKVSYYVQNLKKETNPYHMILICNKKETKKLINLGVLNIDDYGRTEITYEYNIEDILDSRIGVEKVVGAAIIKFVDSNIIPVMLGFITTDTQEDWKKYPIYFKEEVNETAELKVEEVLPVIEEKLEEEPVIEKEPVIEEEPVIKEVPNIEEMPVIGGIPTEVAEDNQVRTEKKVEEDVSSVFDDYEEKIETMKHEEEKELNNNYEDVDFPVGSIGNYFKMVAEGLEEVENVSRDIKRCKWYKVPMKNKKDLCDVQDYDKYTVIYYPMYSYLKYIKKYEHFMIGYKCDGLGRMKYIVFAIPGKKSIMEQPYEGKTGFVTWIPLIEGEETEESQGYWLMFYDFKNRTIAIPIRA